MLRGFSNPGFIGNSPYLGKVIMIGDSQQAQNYAITSGGGSTAEPIHAAQIGPWNHLQARCNFPFDHRLENLRGSVPPYGDNFAVSGDDYNDIILVLRDALQRGGDILWMHNGTNDITAMTNAGYTNDEVIRHVLFADRVQIEQALSYGMTCWVDTIYPRNNDDGADFTANQNTCRLAINAARRLYEQEMKSVVTVFDFDPVLMDPATGKLYSALATDGVHLNSSGAEAASRVMQDRLSNFIGTQLIKRYFTPYYNVTNNPNGDLIINREFTGTTGVVSGTGNSGTAPTSWTATSTDGTSVTCAFSIEERANWNDDDANFVKFEMASTGAGVDNETKRIAPTSTITTGVSIGQWVQLEVEMIIDPVSSGSNILRSVYAELRDSGTSGPISRMFNVGYLDGAVKDYFPDGSYRYILRTVPFRVKTSSGLIVRLNADIDGTLTGARNVYFGQPMIRQLKFERQPLNFVQEFAPLTGTTINGYDGKNVTMLINPAATIAALTVVLPLFPNDGDRFTISTSQTITALTITGTTTSSPTTLPANQGAIFVYNKTTSSWFRVL